MTEYDKIVEGVSTEDLVNLYLAVRLFLSPAVSNDLELLSLKMMTALVMSLDRQIPLERLKALRGDMKDYVVN